MLLRGINYLIIFAIISLIIYSGTKSADFGGRVKTTRVSKQYDDNNQPRLTHVVVPFHAKQIDRMQDFFDLWVKYPPCARLDVTPGVSYLEYNPKLGHQIDLVFFVGSMNDTLTVKQQLFAMYDKLPYQNVKECFSSVTFSEHRFNTTDNSYLLGAKAMFERFLGADLGLNDQNSKPYYAFYMEPDVRPIRPGWLSYTDAQCRWPSPPFWVKGSQFRGTPLPRHCKNIVTKMHINGNALYNLRDPAFREYYHGMVLPFLKAKGHKPWLLAYDLFFMTNVLENEEQYPAYQRHIHKFVLSDFIQNRWHVNYTRQEILDDSESTYLVHGGTVLD